MDCHLFLKQKHMWFCLYKHSTFLQISQISTLIFIRFLEFNLKSFGLFLGISNVNEIWVQTETMKRRLNIYLKSRNIKKIYNKKDAAFR